MKLADFEAALLRLQVEQARAHRIEQRRQPAHAALEAGVEQAEQQLVQ